MNGTSSTGRTRFDWSRPNGSYRKSHVGVGGGRPTLNPFPLAEFITDMA